MICWKIKTIKQFTMSIQVNKNGSLHNIENIYAKSKDGILRTIQHVYRGSVMVWTVVKDFITSCFGGGYWDSKYPWDNKDVWKN